MIDTAMEITAYALTRK
ncbi:hypothetical protein [Streptomyces sp. NPDC005507]